MNAKHFLALIAPAAMLGCGSAQAQTVSVGTSPIYTLSQTEALTNGYDFTLDTSVFENSAGLYTYQYDLTNLNDPGGIATLSPTVRAASDFGTSGLTFFFGGAATGGTVAVDGTVGNDLANASPFSAITNAAGSLYAYGNGGQVLFSTAATNNAIGVGASNAGKFGDYFYLQSHSAPGSADLNVTDNGSADFKGVAPVVPEANTFSLLSLGGLGLLGLTLRTRKARTTVA